MTEAGQPRGNPDRGAIIIGGAHGSLAIARSLGRRGIPIWLITADSPLAGLSRYVTRCLSWPGPNAPDAVGFLIALARNHDLKNWVIFAGSDQALRFLAHHHAALGTVFTLTSPAWDMVKWSDDKRRMNARAAELGIAHPLTRYPRSRDELTELDIPFPVILKPTFREERNAFTDAKAWRADNSAELVARYTEAAALVGPDRIMIQQLIPGDGTTQFSYAGVWDRGRPVGSLVARRRRQYPIDFGFTSTLVETVDAPEVAAIATRFLATLEFNGLVEIEFKFDRRDDCFKILDINARAWTWIGLGAAAGIDFPMLQWNLVSGEDIAPATAQCGAQWLYLSRDIAAVLAEMAAGRLTPLGYFRSLRRPAASALLAWDDPWPAVVDLPLSAFRVITRRLSRRSNRDNHGLQSAKLPT